jgi:hypothetical protein
VTPLHFLVVRDGSAPPEALPQCIHDVRELEDMFLVLGMLGPPYRAYFNSNSGADGSRSGSSVNHWHFQLFPFPREFDSPLFGEGSEVLVREAGLTVGRYPEWPARHLFVDGTNEDFGSVAACLWEQLRRIDQLDVAYNVEVVPTGAREFRAFLFPRRPTPALELPGIGPIDWTPGGWELSGDLVIATEELFAWVRHHPSEALRITRERLRRSTRAPVGSPPPARTPGCPGWTGPSSGA